MKILLDTHILLWSLLDPKKLKKYEKTALVDRDNEIFVSNISFWEISLKYALKKLELKNITPDDLPKFVRQTGFDILCMNEKESSTSHHLPKLHHKDPFDRMLIWQAINQDLYLMTRDQDSKIYTKSGLKLFCE